MTTLSLSVLLWFWKGNFCAQYWLPTMKQCLLFVNELRRFEFFFSSWLLSYKSFELTIWILFYKYLYSGLVLFSSVYTESVQMRCCCLKALHKVFVLDSRPFLLLWQWLSILIVQALAKCCWQFQFWWASLLYLQACCFGSFNAILIFLLL